MKHSGFLFGSLLVLFLNLFSPDLFSKEVALTFDDAPFSDSSLFSSKTRTERLIDELRKYETGPVMIFAVPCRFEKEASLAQLKMYKAAGHHIASHSCSHPDFHKISASEYILNLKKADQYLEGMFPPGHKLFRFPYLHEGASPESRDQVCEWLKQTGYRNGFVSIDTDEWLFQSKINQAMRSGKKINHEKMAALYVEHIVNAMDFYDGLAVRLLGRSPKHVLLLHEIDSSVLYLGRLIKAIRERGWKIIDPIEAYSDPIYFESPNNLYANNGLIAQLAKERGLGKFAFSNSLRSDLDSHLGLGNQEE